MLRRDGLLAALMAGSLMAPGCDRPVAKPAESKPPEVLVSLPTTEEVTDYEEFIGHVDAVQSVEVRARVTGYLKKVNFVDGDEVNQGDLLFEIDDRPYRAEHDRALASLEQGKAHLGRLSRDHSRAEVLLSRNAIGREEYDRIQGDYAEAIALVGVAQAEVDKTQLNLEFTRVTAPISGRLSRRMVDPGNLVQADTTPLTSIVSLDPMYVYFDVDERVMLRFRRLISEGKIKSRQEEERPVLIGLADEGNTFPHVGKINFSDNKVDSSTGTLRVRGSIDNPKPRILSPGMFVRVRLPVGSPHKSILISEQALGADQGKKFVYVVNDKDEVVYQIVEVGSLSNGKRVIDKGLAMGDRVVVSGLQRVRPGIKVVPRSEEEFRKQAADAAAKPIDPAKSKAPTHASIH
ncbi:efflux RND transporter periplasmic adaptor subunit [Tundrisphaera sp. TA3]|uniref:efflux RND transporter periplasmic adaptor subunit n=1 Tax=Tundrisphaera sp. TA3 TaxID=3435775 RepID=UPI003EB92FF6